TVCVAGRRFHREQLRALTGLDVSEGQATSFLNDLRAHLATHGAVPGERGAARRWLTDGVEPGTARAHGALGGRGDPLRADCALVEVRWLLREQAGQDVGDDAALAALARRAVPGGSAAEAAPVELPPAQLPALPAAPAPF